MGVRDEVKRRVFLFELGRGAFAVAVLGAAALACDSGARQNDPSDGPAPGDGPDPATGGDGAVSYERVSLGFVSAYILSRGGEAAVVDTGVGGSAPQIEAGLAAVGLSWDAVAHVILTHLHANHIGSLGDVMAAAPAATGYAGQGDIDQIASPRPLVAVGDGDRVFGLRIIDTPGHTPGHICVLDPVGGLLVAGDALIGSRGGVAGPNPQFTSDLATANESVKKLATFEFETALFGHGEPVGSGASTAVAGLAAGL
jgi:glyoxylase-like metal-dependent hydrolase (beta-lactamase superfamily II)